MYRLVSKNTIEERILHRAKQKDHIQKMVISGDQASSAFKGGGSNDSFKATGVSLKASSHSNLKASSHSS